MIRWFIGLFQPAPPPDRCRYCGTALDDCAQHTAAPALCRNCSYGMVCPIHRQWWLAP